MVWTNFLRDVQNLFSFPVIILCILIIAGFSWLGISFFRKAAKAKDEKKKNSLKWKGEFLLTLPWFLIVASFTYWVIDRILEFYSA